MASEAVKERDMVPCECTHLREDHTDGGSGGCQLCGCARHVSHEMRANLQLLRGKQEVASAPVAATPMVPRKKYPPWPGRTTEPRTCSKCNLIILADTDSWPEPMCYDHYMEQCELPPRVVLTFKDGHREMRNNYVYPAVYRDVEQSDDGSDVVLTWFERTEEQREQGKLVMQFYREIDAPVDSLGREKKQDEMEKVASLLDEYRKERDAAKRLRVIQALIAGAAVLAAIAYEVLK